MKKLARRVLWTLTALCMLFVSATAVYGADAYLDAEQKQAKINVSAYRTQAPATEGKIFSVTINWPDIVAEYKEGYKGTWDTTKLDYEDGWEAGWSIANNRIDIYNYSEVPIEVSFSFEDVLASTNLKYQFTNANSTENIKPALSFVSENEVDIYYVEMPVGQAGTEKGTPSSQGVGFEII
ncbi:MAG: hypothetical protein IKU11_01420, partial [Clostridia bacterium]|nr:hypothetical protein [Clostridia bacterium]